MARKPRQKTLAQRRANPGLRSKLPASQLTPAQRAERGRLQRVATDNRNPLYDPTTQLAGHSLIQAAQDLADVAVKPKVDAINRQMTSATTQGTALAGRAGDYYRQLASREMQGVASQKALADLLNAQTASIGQQGQQAFANMSAAEQQRQAADAALRGPGLGGDASSRVGSEIAAQQGTAATLQQAGANLAAERGSSWANLANAMGQARQLRGGEVQGELLNRLATQQTQGRQQIADTEATRGDLTSENLTKLRQQAYENLVTNQGLNIKQQDLQNQLTGIQTQAATAKANRVNQRNIATQRINATQAYQQAQIDIKRGVDPVTGKRLPKTTSAADALNQWKLDYARKHGHLPSTGSSGSNPTKEPADVRKTRAAVNSISTEIKGLAQGRSRTRVGEIMRSRAARAGQRLPEDLLSAALDLGVDGYVSPRNVKMLKEVYGVTVPAAWRRRPRSSRAGLVAAAQQPGVRPLTPVNTLP